MESEKARKPEVSVIITFHNQKEFVKDCLDSFLSQTIQVPYEIIVIDDDSRDGTEEYVRKNYPMVWYYKTKYHHACLARNYGFQKSRGNYIIWFDGDDWAFPLFLEKLYIAITKTKSNAAYSRFRYGDDLFGFEKTKLPACGVYEWSPDWLPYGAIFNTPTMFTRSLAEKIKWDANLSVHHDYDLNFQVAKLVAKLGGKPVLVREKLWQYRVNDKSIWGSGLALRNHKKSRRYLEKKWNVRRKKIQTTFLSMISRSDILPEYFASIEALEMPKDEIHWLIFVDTNDETLIQEVKKRAAGIKFHTTRILITGETNFVQEGNFTKRAMRVARNLRIAINEIAKPNAYTPYIFGIEDDTIAPPDAFQKLKKLIKKKNVVYASGVECSRAADRHLGIGHLIFTDGAIYHKIPFPPKKSDPSIQEVSSGGWYCWFGKTDILINTTFRCIENRNCHIGPDSLMVYDLSRKGYQCLVDWSVRCKHYDPVNEVFVSVDEGKGYDLVYKL